MSKMTDVDILALNPQLDLQRVADFENFRREIERSGVDLAPRYRVSPPLGELVADESDWRLSANSRCSGK
jgi:hypothetical protein